MLELEVAIELTVPDNSAFTVLVALRALGYVELERAERSDILRLQLEQPPQAATEVVEALKRAEVIFNPNKHRMRYQVSGARAPALHTALAGDGSWEAIVSDRDDDTSGLIRLLRDHFSIAGLRSLERATAWRLYEKDRSASNERLEWACRELLANPYSQTIRVRVAFDRSATATI